MEFKAAFMNIERKFPNITKNLYLFPFIVVLSIPFIIYTLKQGDSRHILAGIFTIIIPLLIVNASKINPFYFVVISFPILALSIAFNAMALEYNSYISIGVWTALFDTDYSESSEFISDTFLITKILTFLLT